MKINCGCSGYKYDDWKGSFYPEELSQNEWLSYYADQFDVVEINGTFYNLPDKSTVKSWDEQTSDDFRFFMKGSRYITHMKKLKIDEDLEEAVDKFHESISPLSDKIAGVLWQLPGNLKADSEKIDDFLELIGNEYQHVVEFRDPSWFSEEIYSILADHKAVFCSISSPEEDLPEDIFSTIDAVYLRMHGKTDWYDHNYSKKELKRWLEKLKNAEASEAWVFFNNTKNQNAPANCRDFQQLIS